MTLQEFFAEHPKAALGFSGGVDSSYLLWAAVNAGADIAPYYIQTAFQPAFELEDAQRLCAQIGVKLNVIRLDALADPRAVSYTHLSAARRSTSPSGTSARLSTTTGYLSLIHISRSSRCLPAWDTGPRWAGFRRFCPCPTPAPAG